MDREQIIATLREHALELKTAGIIRLSLFGSMARGERGSDVDLMAEFDTSRSLTLIGMAGLEIRLAEIVEMPVDLAPTKMPKEHVRERADREAVLVF